jgi:hypothetical protein
MAGIKRRMGLDVQPRGDLDNYTFMAKKPLACSYLRNEKINKKINKKMK